MTLQEFKEYYGGLSPVVKATDVFRQDINAYQIPEKDVPEAKAFMENQVSAALEDPVYKTWFREQLEAKRDRLIKRGKTEQAVLVTSKLERL